MLAKYLLIFVCLFSVPAYANNIWILVDTHSQRMEVKDGNKTVEVFRRVALGRKGGGLKQHRGDNVTPLGTYRIGWVNEKSPFHRFFGLNYPDVDTAKRAYQHGMINQDVLRSVLEAHAHNDVPPQNTPMGGRIGIHGIGVGDPDVHELFNWTHGCIALTDAEIDRLSLWIGEGTVVKII